MDSWYLMSSQLGSFLNNIMILFVLPFLGILSYLLILDISEYGRQKTVFGHFKVQGMGMGMKLGPHSTQMLLDSSWQTPCMIMFCMFGIIMNNKSAQD